MNTGPIDAQQILIRRLQHGRDALVWKLQGLGEYDLRRPMTPTGTNLLGLVKHCAWVEAGYFGDTFGRPFPEPSPFGDLSAIDESLDPNTDLYAAAEESRDDIVGLYGRVQAWAAETFATHGLDSPGRVPWWGEPDVTLGEVLAHVVVEVHRHAGQADIVRELIDSSIGLRADVPNLPGDGYDWSGHVARVEAAARAASTT